MASFYRYAATDCATEEDRPKAISYVLAGGLMAALFGPEIARNTVNGCRIISMLAVIFGICGAVFTAGIGWGENSKTTYPKGGRPWVFIAIRICCGYDLRGHWYALMSYLMTATPLQVVNVAQLGTSPMQRLFNGMLWRCLRRLFHRNLFNDLA